MELKLFQWKIIKGMGLLEVEQKVLMGYSIQKLKVWGTPADTAQT